VADCEILGEDGALFPLILGNGSNYEKATFGCRCDPHRSFVFGRCASAGSGHDCHDCKR
jgi:hypothetical protein